MPAKRGRKENRLEAGFTLVELVVVIAILGILAGIGSVAYNGYIRYAQKGADIELVGEIENAVNLTVQSDPDAVGLGDGEAPAAIGTVFLTHPDSGSGAAVNSPDGILDKALTDTYGSGYADSLQLKYDGWKSGAAGAVGFISDNGNRYMGAEKMMNTLRDFADNFFKYLGSGAANYDNTDSLKIVISVLNEDGSIDQILQQAGIEGGVKGTTADNVANAAVWAVAKYASNNKNNIVDYMSKKENLQFDAGTLYNKFLSALITDKFHGNVDTTSMADAMYSCINTYAQMELLVSYLGSTPEGKEMNIEQQFNDIISSTGDAEFGDDGYLLPKYRGRYRLQQIVNNMADAQKLIADTVKDGKMAEYYDNYFNNGQAAKDAEAFVDIASKINGLQDQYNTAESVVNKNLFTSSDFIEEVSKFTGESSGIMITAMSDGSCIVDPIEASPKSKG